MATENGSGLATSPKLDAPAALAKVLELIRTSEGIDDFTPERIAEVTGLRMNFDGQDRFGAGEQVGPDWNYSFYVNRAAMNGPQFMFSFDPSVLGQSPPATTICATGFDAFAMALEQMGFEKQVWYDEHGGVLKYTFDSESLRVGVGTQGEGGAPPDRPARECVRTVTIN